MCYCWPTEIWGAGHVNEGALAPSAPLLVCYPFQTKHLNYGSDLLFDYRCEQEATITSLTDHTGGNCCRGNTPPMFCCLPHHQPMSRLIDQK